jgi:uncharacterized membrane protein YfcA
MLDISKKKSNGKSAEERFSKLVKEFREKKKKGLELPRTKVNIFNLKTMEYEFYGEKYSVPTVKIGLISFIVGIVGGIYGIGGGAIMAPFFVAFFGLPVYTVAGAALMGTFITSIAGVIFYQLLALNYTGIAIAPDWLLGILFGVGGFAGMYFGAFLQKYLPASFIKTILALCICLIALKYIIDYIS